MSETLGRVTVSKLKMDEKAGTMVIQDARRIRIVIREDGRWVSVSGSPDHCHPEFVATGIGELVIEDMRSRSTALSDKEEKKEVKGSSFLKKDQFEEDETDPAIFATEKQKPPLGVMPRKLWEQKRREELADAIIRYLQAGGAGNTFVDEWWLELQQLSKSETLSE